MLKIKGLGGYWHCLCWPNGHGGPERSVEVVRVSPGLSSGLTTGQSHGPPGLGPCVRVRRLGSPAGRGESVRALSRVAGDSGDSDSRKCWRPKSTHCQATVTRYTGKARPYSVRVRRPEQHDQALRPSQPEPGTVRVRVRRARALATDSESA